MVDFSDPETALKYNPGWSVFAALNGRFPLGFSDTYTAQSEGGTTLDQLGESSAVENLTLPVSLNQYVESITLAPQHLLFKK